MKIKIKKHKIDFDSDVFHGAAGKHLKIGCGFIIAFCIGFAAVLVGGSMKAPVLANSMVEIVNGESHGSGVDIGNGYVLTAEHVVNPSDGSPPIPQAKNKKPVLKAVDSQHHSHKVEVLWDNRDYDVALLRIDHAKNITPANLACNADYSLGEQVAMSGNPLNLTNITTFGRIAKAKPEFAGRWKLAITVSGLLIPGMSGGPVFDNAGDVIGINVGVLRTTEPGAIAALSWVVPSTTICMLLDRH